MSTSPIIVAVGLVMLFVAGLARGFTGFGMGIVAIPLLSLMMPPTDAVVIVLLLQVYVSLLNFRTSVKLCHWPLVSKLTVGSIVATPLGSWALLYMSANMLRLCIAVIVFATAVTLAAGYRLKMIPSGWQVLAFGVASGVLNGLAGMSGPPVVAFFLAAPLSVAVARASMIMFFLISAVLALLPLAIFGKFHLWSMAGSLMGLPVVLLGSVVGTKLYLSSNGGHFRFISIGLLVLAAVLAGLRAFGGFVA
ncbi:MAG: sulfite exporter TauE/SafE family protein [Acidocella sp.]|nr:sulfite exporter TauE/SafE family protein [Acidocella sp.]